jgi:hypothetical protein
VLLKRILDNLFDMANPKTLIKTEEGHLFLNNQQYEKKKILRKKILEGRCHLEEMQKRKLKSQASL